MPRHNRNFQLTIADIDLIEEALRLAKADLAMRPEPEDGAEDRLRRIQDLLGRLHNQKVFYRPQTDTYVSG